LFAGHRSDDDLAIVEVLRELECLNLSIRDRIAECRDSVVQELGEVRQNRMRLLRYRSGAEDVAPHQLDRDA
jgi:Mg2+ and Co2+ transporter CorA